ncbi:hypothetical protein BFW88_07535 [Pseudomonas fluorescens]|nr:hypothetical protein BFW88_07535 [Pseudomonas fluorescens]OPB12920.1 hypothetical protein BFW92_07510 [Pseudomonas fluorescens]OPB25319.1 hypothetical protein BFW93_07530 [Pseudomonas fluorescens]
MRVPIYPQDLNSGSGFARLAKCLKRDWPGAEPIQLSEAQNLLARCFGYSDYHQVKSTTPQDVSYPSLAYVVAQCMKTLSSELIGGERAKFFDLGKLHAQVIDWPFLQLSVYREHYGHSDNRVVGQAVNAELIETFLSTRVTKPSIQPDCFSNEFSFEKLQSMTGHAPVNTTSKYMSTSMGKCTNEDSVLPNAKCVTCGPSAHRKLH